MTRRFHLLHLACMALVAASFTIGLIQPTVAAAEVERTKIEEPANPSGRLAISPARLESDVQPGVRTVVRVQLTNEGDEALDVTVSATDLGAASNPQSLASRVEDGEFGAADWFQSEVTDILIEPFERVSFDVVIDPPVDAPVGTNMGGIVVDGSTATGEPGTADNEGVFNIEGLIQAFLTVPGPVKHDVRITDVDVRDSFVVGKRRLAVWELTLDNRGTVNEHVQGTFDVRSIFGNSATKIPIKDTIVLRGSKRVIRIVWDDVPWIGRFSPDVRLRADDAKRITAAGEAVTVFPWWIPLVIAALIVGPALLLWWRRRQEWKTYLDDEDHGADDEWDDDPTLAR
ncbi:MAG: hypothetical protein JWM90_1729 [Thermoleophilia bacterium]|nr:hypothetical protein [Thermoleophilia bacterium]